MKSEKSKSCGGIVIREDGKVAIVKHSGRHGIRLFPKGHIENGESEEACAVREIREEAGISDIEIIKKLGSYERYRMDENGEYDKGNLKEIVIFLAKTNQKDLLPATDPFIEGMEWVDIEKAPEMLDNKEDREFFNSIKSEIRQP